VDQYLPDDVMDSVRVQRKLGFWMMSGAFLLGIVVLGFVITLYGSAALAQGTQAAPYKIGLTTVFLDDQTSFVKAWSEYLEKRLGRRVEFIQRKSYREINDLLINQELDAAWICGLPYVRLEANKQSKLLAVALYQGRPLYQSYLIVPASDKDSTTIGDLKRRVFAYADPDSNSGFLVPQVLMLKLGIDPRHFFSKNFFTWSHRDVIVAVAKGLAQGGAVDGYVWETLAKIRPDITSKTRVIRRSPLFGFPPFVVRTQLPDKEVQQLQQVLLQMNQDPAGKGLLQRLNLDGFVAGNDHLFDSIRSANRYYERSKQ